MQKGDRMRPMTLLASAAMTCLLGCGSDTSGPQPTEPTPSHLTAVLVGGLQHDVDVEWTLCPDDDFASYSIYRSTCPDISANPDSAVVVNYSEYQNDGNWFDTTTEWSTTYYYAVLTTDTEDLTAWSNEDSVTTPPENPVPEVTGLEIDPSTAGVTVVLNWNPASGVDGYKVWFKASVAGSYEEIGDVTVTTFTHIASSAGIYAVTAYIGDDQSDYSAAVTTAPYIILEEYSIYDNYSPPDYFSGAFFGANGAELGFASSSGFVQDIYTYDPVPSPSAIFLYGGNYGPFGDGYETWLIALGDPGASNPGAAPDEGASWWQSGQLSIGDVVFCSLFDGYYVKMYILDVFAVGGTTNGTGMTFAYEFQVMPGLRLFTPNLTASSLDARSDSDDIRAPLFDGGRWLRQQ
jgi:hypothetical protein